MNFKKPKGTYEEDLDDEYFEGEDDNPEPQGDGEDEIDPLDAYMQDLDENVKKVEHLHKNTKTGQEILTSDDPLDSYLDSMKDKLIKEHNKKHNIQKKGSDSEGEGGIDEEDQTQYDFLDSEGNIDFDALRKKKKEKIEPLPTVDHTKIEYEPFNKDFYEEHEEIAALPNEKVKELRHDMEIKVHGSDVPKPIVSFAHLNFDEKITNLIIKKSFEKPTPIQCQALPCGLSGRDVIGIAKTGSGKTLAYVWPLIIHVLDQRVVEKNEGPIGLILCPTRELAQQVYLETKKFAKIYEIKVAALLGGENKHEQWKELKAGVDILVATPGRLIEMVKKKATNLRRCTYTVLDEADRMFSMGFEYQVRSIIGQVRPDRQILLFSATFQKKVQKLCMDILNDPIRINIGKENQANEDVKQEVACFTKKEDKFAWILANLPYLSQHGKILIFANQIATCEELAQQIIQSLGLPTLVLHGDKLQHERTMIINTFKTSHEQNILVATDIASRGLDIPELRAVINYEVPKDGDTYIHRIGRTGRAGNKEGTAYTLLLKHELQFSLILTKILEISGQPVPRELEEIALLDEEYVRHKKMKKMGLSKHNAASKLLEKALKRGKRDTAGLGFNKDKPKESTKDKDRDKGSMPNFADALKEIRSLSTAPVQFQPPQTQHQAGEYTFTINQQTPQYSSYGAQPVSASSVSQQYSQYGVAAPQSYFQPQTSVQATNVYQSPQQITYQTGMYVNKDNRRNAREEIMSEYANKMKSNMQTSFQKSFVSSGSLEASKGAPTIKFSNKHKNPEHDLQPKPSNITITLPKNKFKEAYHEPTDTVYIPPEFEAPLTRGKFGSSAEDSIRKNEEAPRKKSRFSDRPASSEYEPDPSKKNKMY